MTGGEGKTHVKITTKKKKTKTKQCYSATGLTAPASTGCALLLLRLTVSTQQNMRRQRGSDDMATEGNPGPVNRSEISENFRRTYTTDYRVSSITGTEEKLLGKKQIITQTNSGIDLIPPFVNRERRRTLGTARQ